MTRTDIINELVGRGYEAFAIECTKNGVILEGIHVINKNSNLNPVIYTQPFIDSAEKENLSLNEVVEEILKLIKESENKSIDVDKLLSREFLEEHLFVAFFKHVEKNTLFKDTEFEGIKSILMIRFDLDGHSSVKVNKGILETAGVSEEEAWEIAERNTLNDTVVTSMSELFGLPGTKPMYVITNKNKLYGASAVLNKTELAKIADDYHVKKLFLIPSSIHEMIAIPCIYEEYMDELNAMINEVNEREVEPCEQLADRAFIVEI